MAIAVTVLNTKTVKLLDGRFLNFAELEVTGLTAAAANTIPHGLPEVPISVGLVPGAAGLWGQTQVADATNIYVTVGTAGATSGWLNVVYGRP